MDSDLPDPQQPDEPVPPEDARRALAELLTDGAFHATDRNRRFLQFVSEEMLEGRSATIKAYSIAVDVFGRSESFDPSTDPIVRIEATRLRASLSQYYEQDDRGCGIRIGLPKGGYVPTFSRAPPDPADDADEPAPEEQIAAEGKGLAAVDPPPTDAPGPIVFWKRPRAAWASLAIATCIALLALYRYLPGTQPTSFSLKPIVSLTVVAVDPSLAASANSLRDAMQIAITQFQTVRMAAGSLSKAEAGPDIRQAAYRIEVKYAVTEFDRGAWWQLVDVGNGEAVQSGVERVFINARTAEEVETKLAGAMAVELVGGRGAVATTETARELADPTLGHGCVLRGALALEDGRQEALANSRACLERSLRLRPNDADAEAALAQVLLKIDRPEAPTSLAPEALVLATNAVRLNPFSDRASAALMAARFRNGQVEAALMAGRRAMELNPNNGAVPAKFGSMLYRIGRWDEALRMVARAQEVDAVAYPEINLTRAMDAYRRGDYREALLLEGRMGDAGCFCARVLRVAILGQLGMAEEARAAAVQFELDGKDFGRNFRIAMAARHFDVALTDGLQAGLVKAGLTVGNPPT